MFFKSIQTLVESGARNGLGIVDLAREMDAMTAWRGKVEQQLFKHNPAEQNLADLNTTADVYIQNMGKFKFLIAEPNYIQVVAKPVKGGVLLLREDTFGSPALQYADILRRRIILMRTAKEVIQKWMPKVTKNLTVFVLGVLALGVLFQKPLPREGDFV